MLKGWNFVIVVYSKPEYKNTFIRTNNIFVKKEKRKALKFENFTAKLFDVVENDCGLIL